MYTRLTSAQSIAFDCDRNRLSRSAFSEACICTLKPRSLVACSAIRGIAVTGGPAWRSTISLASCAHIVGNPPNAPAPADRPAPAAAPLRTVRRDGPLRLSLQVSDMFGTSAGISGASSAHAKLSGTAAEKHSCVYCDL